MSQCYRVVASGGDSCVTEPAEWGSRAAGFGDARYGMLRPGDQGRRCQVAIVEFRPGLAGAIGRFKELVRLAGGTASESHAAMRAKRPGDDDPIPTLVGFAVRGLAVEAVRAIVSLVVEEFPDLSATVR